MRIQPCMRLVAVAVVLVASLGPTQSSASDHAIRATQVATGTIRGRVVTKDAHRPVKGAAIVLPDYGLTATSSADGSFQVGPIPTSHPYRRIATVVTAAGWGRWSIDGVPLYPGDTLNLNVELRKAPFDHRVLTPAERATEAGPTAPASSYTYTCTGWKAGQTPPDTISVYITEEKAATRYDFTFYVTHVLPDEWYPSWNDDSLGAGAIAVKDYGWYRAKSNHAYSGGDGCADLVDTGADQVFDPTWDSDFTNQAVYATLGSVFWKDGKNPLSQYFAGAPDDPCAPVEGEYAGRMSQWGTQTCALDSMLWPDITTTFYDDHGDSEWLTLYDLVLNPGAENSQLYAWIIGTGGGELTRVKGGGHDGEWYFSVTSTDTGRIYEERPFLGDANDTYHYEVATRCETSNSGSCTITLKVVAIAEDGTKVGFSKNVTEKNDGTWRVYTYDPPASGIDHTLVRWRISSKQSFGFDSAVLTGSFGGP
jgi:Stage II sporulation protein